MATTPVRCGLCEAPAVVRYAYARLGEAATNALARWAGYRCGSCFLSPTWTEGISASPPGFVLVIDPRFTRRQLGHLCGCGLPAGHADGPETRSGWRPCRRPPSRRPRP